jgi:hypothetical protein
MRTINRQAILLRKKQPFVDWLTFTSKTHDPPKYRAHFKLDEVNRECHIYLIEDIEALDVAYEYIEFLKPSLFEAELSGWYNANASHLWPQDRSNDVFDNWFEIELHSMVIDIEKNSLKRDKHPL